MDQSTPQQRAVATLEAYVGRLLPDCADELNESAKKRLAFFAFLFGSTQKTRWRLLAAIGLVAVGSMTGWQIATWATNRNGPSTNAIMVIAPYWYNGTWVFDDPAVGLRREPFVAGVPEMIDGLVKNTPDSKDGVRLTISANPFPGFQSKLIWLRGDSGGNYYKRDQPPMEGWICRAMFRYYKTAPRNLYVKAEPKRR
jgi:hypothetical protein